MSQIVAHLECTYYLCIIILPITNRRITNYMKLSKEVINKKTHKSDLEKKVMAQAMKIVMKILSNKKTQIVLTIVLLILFIFSIIGIVNTVNIVFN